MGVAEMAIEKKSFEEIWLEACEAGLNAVKELNVIPMIVQEHANPFDDNSPVVKQWYEPEGVCGFAWVFVKPGNCKFANWLKKNGKARPDSYYGGVSIWISQFGQSMQKKEAYAIAMADVFRKYDIRATYMSRLD